METEKTISGKWVTQVLAVLVQRFIAAINNTKIQRTELGDQFTEYIYGMKNFIHDFSMLEDATKDALILWDDFLIYAVVLEENDKIIEEIFMKRDLNPFKFKVL